jgi:hypothetical protein
MMVYFKFTTKCFVAAIVCFLLSFQLRAQQIAFPGAEGAGKFTSGGRGTTSTLTTVFEVTNLTDANSPGSLRYACSQSITTYPYRTIVFRVSGTIHLSSKLSIPKNTTIAGQTAPGDGICLADYPVVISGDNIIVRYIRIRMGDKNQLKTTPSNCGIPVTPFQPTCMPLDGSGGDDAFGDLGHKNLIIDHCTVSWSTDEALTFYRGDSLTLQWNIISEPLNYSYHFETGDTDFEHHGYGGIWGSLHGSFHHNLFAHCQSRNPRFGGNSTYAAGSVESADFRNNVIYNWGLYTVYGGEGGQYNLVNNYYKFGPSTGSGTKNRIVNVDSNAANGYAHYYLSGNYVDGSTANTANNWSGASMNTNNAADTVKSKVTVPYLSNYLPSNTDAAVTAYDTVLKSAGCIIPNRDTLDIRIINDVKNRNGKLIDVQGGFPHATPYDQTVNAWPYLATSTPPVDTDHDGMPDNWETANSLNPNNAADRGIVAANGYTNLENYLNSITATVTAPAPTSPASATWTLLTDQSPSTVGDVTATNQSIGSLLTGIQYGSTFGGISGWQRVATSGLPIGYNADSYTEYKISPTAGKYFTATSVELGALGGGTGSARMSVYYSLDNFATSFPVGACTYNGSSYDATTSGTPVVLLNTSTTPLTGQQIATLPTNISVSPSKTLTVRIYGWITGTGTRYFASQNVQIKGVSSDAVLPLSLINFSASLENGNAKLFWNTTTEINVKNFEVQRSDDGNTFNTVGSVTAFNGLSNSYSYLDNSKINNVVYYRLKMINKDGTFTYSKVISISNKIKETISIYPNPATQNLTLYSATPLTSSTVNIISAEGRVVKNISINPASKYNVIDVAQLTKGIYLLQYMDNNERKSIKFIKQ